MKCNQDKDISRFSESQEIKENELQEMLGKVAKFREENQKYILPHINIQGRSMNNCRVVQMNNTLPIEVGNKNG